MQGQAGRQAGRLEVLSAPAAGPCERRTPRGSRRGSPPPAWDRPNRGHAGASHGAVISPRRPRRAGTVAGPAGSFLRGSNCPALAARTALIPVPGSRQLGRCPPGPGGYEAGAEELQWVRSRDAPRRGCPPCHPEAPRGSSVGEQQREESWLAEQHAQGIIRGWSASVMRRH